MKPMTLILGLTTAIGLALGALLGWQSTGTLGGMATTFFICTVLAVLEISLSFDNAIVNANKLKEMSPVWQRRFLTWGIIIAVFGGVRGTFGFLFIRQGWIRAEIGAVFEYYPEMTVLIACALLMFLTGSNELTAPAISLEGRSIWILQSMPVDPLKVL